MPGHNFALFCQYSSFLLCWTSWTNGFTSVVNFGSSQIILLKILLLLFFLFSIWYTNYTYITLFEIFPQFWYVYFILFFLILFSFTFQSRKFLRPIIKHTDSFLSCIMSSNELTIGIICLLYIYIYIYLYKYIYIYIYKFPTIVFQILPQIFHLSNYIIPSSILHFFSIRSLHVIIYIFFNFLSITSNICVMSEYDFWWLF